MMRAVLLVGPPGSGKGTQAKKLAHVADLYHLSSGDIFRAIPKGSKESALQQEYIVKATSMGLKKPLNLIEKSSSFF